MARARFRRTLGSTLLVVGMLGLAGTAFGADDAAEARRTTLFVEAKKLAGEGRWAEAATRLREVIELRSAPKALIALALVERELVHHLEAKKLLDQAVVDAKSQQLDEDVAAATRALADLDPLIPRVTLRGAEGAEGVAVFVDDQPALMDHGAVLMDPGTHVLRIEIPGRAAQRETLTVAPKDHPTIALAPAAASPVGGVGPSGSPGTEPTDTGPWLAAPMVVGGVGIAAATVGVVVMALGAGQQSDAEDACGGTTACPIALQPDVDAGATKIIAGDVLIGVGGAAAITGVVWLIVEVATSGTEPASAAARSWSPAPGGFALRF